MGSLVVDYCLGVVLDGVGGGAVGTQSGGGVGWLGRNNGDGCRHIGGFVK